MKDRYNELYIELERFMELCNIADYTDRKNYKKFSSMIHDLNDQIYLLELINKQEEIEIIK